MKKWDQRGSGIIELLVILLVIGAVGFVGWYIWQNHHKVVSSKQASTQASVSKNVAPFYDSELKQYQECLQASGSRTPAVPICSTSNVGTTFKPLADNAKSLHYVTIKEWGIRAPYYGSQDITYSIVDAADSHQARFSSKQISALIPDCSGMVMLQKYTANEQVYGEDGADIGLGAAKDAFKNDLANKNSRTFVSQVGDNYYLFHGPQSACTDMKSESDYQAEATARLVADTIRSFSSKWEAVPAQ